MSTSLGFLLFVFLTVIGLETGDICITPNNETANCISLYSCTILLQALLSDKTTREFVRKSNCGGTAIEPMVCCGSSSNFAVQINKTDECITPNNETATCISLYSCPVLLNAPLSDPKTSEFLRQSNCGGTTIEPMVCCGSYNNFVTDQINKKKQEYLLPIKKICGLQHSDDYFHTVNGTVITEFPWLALITETVKFYPFMCSGSLISARYVLTIAQCLEQAKLKLMIVRLGKYYIGNKSDCIEDSYIYECSELQDFGIEKTVIHPQYVVTPYSHAPHNIGLIRLNSTVKYSDYIRPICLPASDTKRASVGDTVVTSGWGLSTKTFKLTEIKKKTFSQLISIADCKILFLYLSVEVANKTDLCTETSLVGYICDAMYNLSMSLGDNELCSLFESEAETVLCGGDEGSPVMYSYMSQWYLEGIVSLSSITCDVGTPNVFIKVVNYVEWIKETLRP